VIKPTKEESWCNYI